MELHDVLFQLWMLGTIVGVCCLAVGKSLPGNPQKYVFDNFIAHTPVANDPFTHVMTDISPLPNEYRYSFWQFLYPIMFGGSTLFMVYAYLMSLVTLEWNRFDTFRREAWMTAKSLFITSPVLAYVLAGFFSEDYGKLYYDDAGRGPVYTYLISPLLFFIVSDATFYWGHRLWHSSWLYNHSHFYHHTCRPTTSFAGNAADVFEIIMTGYLAACLPVLLVPIHARIFLILTVFSHIWTIFLHNNNAIRVGFGIYDGKDHNIHHAYGEKNYNFGLYFQFWDRVMGTYKESHPTLTRLGAK